MWKNTSKKAPIAVFLGWILFLSLFVTGVLLLLEPYSVSYMEHARMIKGN